MKRPNKETRQRMRETSIREVAANAKIYSEHEVLHDRTPGLERELIELRQRYAKLVRAVKEVLDKLGGDWNNCEFYSKEEKVDYIYEVLSEALGDEQ